MTGFGEAAGRTALGELRVELRTVNHRYLNVNAKLPTALARWDGELREWLRAFFVRGHVNCTARLERDPSLAAGTALRLDTERVEAYLRLFRELGDRFGIGGSADLDLLSRFGDIVVRDADPEESAIAAAADLRDVVLAAARAVVEMREEEGKRLEIDLRGRLGAIDSALGRIEERAPRRVELERDRLRAAVAALLGEQLPDEARIAQEIVLLAERWDVNEEIVRFRSHIELFTQLLDGPAAEGVGKRLSFLVQEMNREANTIGSKANDAVIAHEVVTIKDELERLREQVENVE